MLCQSGVRSSCTTRVTSSLLIKRLPQCPDWTAVLAAGGPQHCGVGPHALPVNTCRASLLRAGAAWGWGISVLVLVSLCPRGQGRPSQQLVWDLLVRRGESQLAALPQCDQALGEPQLGRGTTRSRAYCPVLWDIALCPGPGLPAPAPVPGSQSC